MNTSPTHILNALAEVKAQTLDSLFGTDFDDADDFDGVFSRALLSQIPDMESVTVGVLSALISPTARHAGRNMFIGIGEGLSGIDDFGVTVEPGGTLMLDGARLDAMLASNMKGVVNATREFGTGDTASPSGQAAKALAAYRLAGGIQDFVVSPRVSSCAMRYAYGPLHMP